MAKPDRDAGHPEGAGTGLGSAPPGPPCRPGPGETMARWDGAGGAPCEEASKGGA